MRQRLVVLVTLLVATGCGREALQLYPAPEPGTTRYEVSTLILETPDHGPQLCGGVLESLPPQCSGPDIIGWDWGAATGEETALGHTWGEYHVVGSWDSDAFTFILTEPPSAPLPSSSRVHVSSPCPEPEGGWRPLDPNTATAEAKEAAAGLARADPGHAGLWSDHSPNPVQDLDDVGGSLAEFEWRADDPALVVLNVATTGDTAILEAKLRSVWGGALCVSEATYTHAELQAIVSQIADMIDRDVERLGRTEILSVWADQRENVVRVGTYVADKALRATYQGPFPENAVELNGFLRPVADEL